MKRGPSKQRLEFMRARLDFWAHATKHRTLREASASQSARYRHIIQRIIEDGMRTGEFRGDADAELTAAALLGQLQGLLTQWTLNSRSFDLMEATAICQQAIMAYVSPSQAA